MKKIAVIGLYDIKNAGDNILCDATQYLIKEKNPKVKIVEVDVSPIVESISGVSFIPFMLGKVLIKISAYIFSYENNSRFRYLYEYFMWWLNINTIFQRKLKDVDAIVFAGGGFLKFRTQGLNYFVEQIIKIAKKNKIPVMMNGVGIEGYDEKDIRCQRLKKAINSDCVKIITTRDYIDVLNQCYITNKNIRTSLVGDPALWTPEVYGVPMGKNEKKRLGINVIRGKVFQAYGNTLSEYQLLNFYKSLIKGVEMRGWDWVLFSNGMKADQVFGAKILAALSIPESSGKLLSPPKNPQEFLAIIKSFSAVFGARLHTCITSYALDIPVAGLIWSEKLEKFAKLISKENHFFPEEGLHIENVLNALEECKADRYDESVRDELRCLTQKYINEFLDYLNE